MFIIGQIITKKNNKKNNILFNAEKILKITTTVLNYSKHIVIKLKQQNLRATIYTMALCPE